MYCLKHDSNTFLFTKTIRVKFDVKNAEITEILYLKMYEGGAQKDLNLLAIEKQLQLVKQGLQQKQKIFHKVFGQCPLKLDP